MAKLTSIALAMTIGIASLCSSVSAAHEVTAAACAKSEKSRNQAASTNKKEPDLDDKEIEAIIEKANSILLSVDFNNPQEQTLYARYSNAVSVYDTGISRHPDVPELYRCRAKLLEWLGDSVKDGEQYMRKSIADLDSAIELEPKSFNAHYNRYVLWTKLGNNAKAMQDANSMVALWPRDPEGYRLRSLQYRIAGRFDKALEEANKSVELAEKHKYRLSLCDCLQTRAKFYFVIKESDKAIADARRSLSVNTRSKWELPESAHIGHTLVAGVYLQQEKYKEALNEASQGLLIYPHTPPTTDLLICQAKAYVGLGYPDEGLAVLESAIYHWPTCPKLYFERGQLYNSQRNSDLATKDFNKVKELQNAGFGVGMGIFEK